jgi:hypothetical protein
MRFVAANIVTFVVMPLILTGRLHWPEAGGRYAWYRRDLPASLTILQGEHKRAQQLAALKARRRSQEQNLGRLVDNLVSGNTSLAEIVRWILASPSSQGFDCFLWARSGYERGDSDEERVCRRLLHLVELRLANDSSNLTKTMARLEAAMAEFIGNDSAGPTRRAMSM